jgi:uncharacterized membrane protein
VGWARGEGNKIRAVEWSAKGTLSWLTIPGGFSASVAYSITDDGWIAGAIGRRSRADSSHEDEWRAVVWRNGQPIELPALREACASVAFALNGQGRAAGACWGRAAEASWGVPRPWPDTNKPKVCVWEKDRLADLEELKDAPGLAWAMNRHGWVVGWYEKEKKQRAFVWTGQKVLDHRTLLTGGSTVELSVATGINDDGWIVGLMRTGEKDEAGRIREKGFLLKPATTF